MKKIIVCGAGIGGMVSAILLSAKGHEVRNYEKNDEPGGKMGEIRRDGYRFDTGPSLITMPFVFREFFDEIKREMTDYFELTEIDSSCRYFWSDGTVFNSYTDKAKSEEELKNVFGDDTSDSYFRYLEYAKIFYNLSLEDFIGSDINIRNYLSKEGIKNLFRLISGRSVNDLSNKFFKEKKLKQMMDRFATFSGSTPFLAPQFFSVIPYIENEYGAWYVKGGIYKIAEGLRRLCGEFNVEIHYGCELKDISQNNKKITSLKFRSKDGKTLETDKFDTVVSNFTNSLRIMDKDYFKNDDWANSAFIIKAGMKKKFSELSHHNIFFADDYEKEYIDIFEKKIPSDDMTIYISISSKTDLNDAPAGCENWFIMVNAPYLNPGTDWTEKYSRDYCNRIIDRLNRFDIVFGGNIHDHIEFCDIFTPGDFKNKYNCENGSIYGLSSNTLYTILKRPKNKSDKFDNLYFTGGNTHPGGGVPLCFQSGRIISTLI